MPQPDKFSGLGNAEAEYIDNLYRAYLEDPLLVEESWRNFFRGFEFARENFPANEPGLASGEMLSDEFKVLGLINAYRERGHYFTLTNPVRKRRKYSPTLDISNFGLGKEHLTKQFLAGKEIGIGSATLEEITDRLNQTYCRSVGVEYMYIRNPSIVNWLKEKMEKSLNTPVFSVGQKKHILKMTAGAVSFEKFIRTKYPGQKSFSLEGAEALIPALDAVIRKGAGMGCKEFVIGMPHRGRLNVLANILHKSYRDIFSEFEGKPFDDHNLLGDVKYHLGYSSDYTTEEGRTIHLTLCPNPSHLEAVGPVTTGIVRAKNDSVGDNSGNLVVPVIIHGDASIAGQGVVYETVQMSELEGYHVGGTIHLVVNNQLGFTTNYLDARSSIYCTDVAKVIQSPIFHVNGDDVEAVVYTILLAMEYRAEFHKDVFIDLLCYRKYGHNESDEPRFTQPLLYKIIESHPNLLEIYIRKLEEEKIFDRKDLSDFEKELAVKLEENLEAARENGKASIRPFLGDLWTGFKKADSTSILVSPDTGTGGETLARVGERLTRLPEAVRFFRKIVKLIGDRRRMIAGELPLDWAMCELMAFATLLDEGIPVRMSGQDVKRGTFSQRHSVLTIEDSEQEYSPLDHISDTQASFRIFNSLLSEYGVLGFEYGYALASPGGLTLWEAQFGDFSNGAQIIIDQFLVCAEEKWNVMNGLVLLLPHGYEGQGPEHSSARLERFLGLCADNNIQVVCPTDPANYFHLLRRQVHREFRKPLIVFTPKSLLRNPFCVSQLESLARGRFREVIAPELPVLQKAKRVLLCYGKIYYDLLQESKNRQDTDCVMIRIEQLYPFPEGELGELLSHCSPETQFLWVQEEPANMGAWPFVMRKFRDFPILLVARPDSASPATGSSSLHKNSQRKIIEKAFGVCDCKNIRTECPMMCSPKEWNV